ncbi:MAG: hypothetical protein R2747_00690 [Pyrinomonadaceae bacterium]
MHLYKKTLALVIGCLGIIMIGKAQIHAQGGGKAMPNRIAFKKGGFSQNSYGSLKEDQIAEYVFGARKGQTVKVRINSFSPKGKFHAFSILGLGDLDFATEQDVNYEYEFTAPETGDYQIDVIFRPTEKVRSGKYQLKLEIE